MFHFRRFQWNRIIRGSTFGYAFDLDFAFELRASGIFGLFACRNGIRAFSALASDVLHARALLRCPVFCHGR